MADTNKPDENPITLSKVTASTKRDIDFIKENHKEEIDALKRALATAVKEANDDVKRLKKLTVQASKDAEKILKKAVKDAEKLLQKAAREADRLRRQATGKPVAKKEVKKKTKKKASKKKKTAKKTAARKKAKKK